MRTIATRIIYMGDFAYECPKKPDRRFKRGWRYEPDRAAEKAAFEAHRASSRAAIEALAAASKNNGRLVSGMCSATEFLSAYGVTPTSARDYRGCGKAWALLEDFEEDEALDILTQACEERFPESPTLWREVCAQQMASGG